jgi:hypothetical protein
MGKTLGTTPAVAAGVELERWSLEQVGEMTAEYLRRKEDAKFEAAFAVKIVGKRIKRWINRPTKA